MEIAHLSSEIYMYGRHKSKKNWELEQHLALLSRGGFHSFVFQLPFAQARPWRRNNSISNCRRKISNRISKSNVQPEILAFWSVVRLSRLISELCDVMAISCCHVILSRASRAEMLVVVLPPGWRRFDSLQACRQSSHSCLGWRNGLLQIIG